jgi:hypothetical protein
MSKILIEEDTARKVLKALEDHGHAWARHEVQYSNAMIAMREALTAPVQQEMVDRLLDEAKLLADDRPVEVGHLPDWSLDAEHMIRRLVKAFNTSQPAPVQQEPVIDHEVAALVNRLRDIAVAFHATEQLRDRIAHEIGLVIAAPQPAQQQEPVAWMSDRAVGFRRSEFGSTPTVPLYTAPPAQQQEPTCKQDLQIWVQRTGQFSWEPQDERFWTRMQPAQQQEPVASKLLKQEEEIKSLRNDLRRAHDAYCQLTREPAQQQEPFGYFKAEPFGWTDCAETDEGAIALYEHPPAQQGPGIEVRKSKLSGKYFMHPINGYELTVGDKLYTAPPAQRKPLPRILDICDIGQNSLQLVFSSRFNADAYKAAIKEKA